MKTENRLTVVRALLLAVIIAAIAVTGFALTAPEFGVVPLSNPDGIVLIIGGPLLHPSTASANGGWIGYNIYRRKAGDPDFVRITSAPLSRPGSLAELEKAMGGSIEGFERFAGLTSKQELWKSIESGDTAIIPISFLSKNFRKALGLLLVDTKVEKKVTYEYRATLVASNGSESTPSETQSATFGEPMIPLLGPASVNARSTEHGVTITWTPNTADSGAFSYSIYRSPDSLGTLLRLNLAALTLDIDSAAPTASGTFVDTTARPGRMYYYCVVSADYVGNESPRARLLPVRLDDIAAPPIPQNLFANPSELGIALTWDTVTGANITGYNVYRSTDADSNYARLNTVILPRDTGYFEDHTATLVDRFFYRVTALSRSGRESERSARALSLYENRLPPVPPQEVKASATDKGIELTWQAGQEPDLRGYYVFRADGFNGILSQVSPLIEKDSTHYLDTSGYLSGSSQYWYLLQSINYTGIVSRYSTPVSARIERVEAADAPRSFFGYADGAAVRLFWTRSSDNNVTGYIVYRIPDTDTTGWIRLNTAPISDNTGTYSDTTGTMGNAYRYRIRALDAKGTESAASHELRVVLFEPAPLPPAGIRISSVGNSVKIVWNRTMQPSVVGYRLYRRTETEVAASVTAEPLPVHITSCLENPTRHAVRYYYSIACVDKYGRESIHSPEVPYFRD